MKLNQAQLEAVHYTNGPCLVLAGAGSGKTRVIITKIANLIHTKQALPEQILAVTFTNKAANEMRERIALEMSEDIASKLTICTFHSLGRIILKEQAKTLGISKNFSIFDETDVTNIIKQIIVNDYPMLKDANNFSYIESICNKISMWKGELKTPKSLASDPTVDSIVLGIYQKYNDYLRACNAVDFDDLIFIPTRLLLLSETTRNYYQNKFRYILVDEYQDTNETQYYMLMSLMASNQRFTVVGDDDQSIYSWRGARPENIKKMTEDFPDLKVIMLEQNYRSTSRILRCANSIIANNPHIFEKKLFSGFEEGDKIRVIYCDDGEQACEFIAAEILGHKFDRKTRWQDYAILYRSNSEANNIEKELTKSRIPFKVTGDTSFFSKMEVKDMLAWCRLIANPKDDAALLRIINVPNRGIGAGTIKYMTDLSHKYGRCLYDCAVSAELKNMLNPSQQDAINGFLGLLIDLRSMLVHHQYVELCDSIINRIGYEEHLKKDNSEEAFKWKLQNATSIIDWIKELVDGSKGEYYSFTDAIERLGLREMMDKRSNSDEEQDEVQMMTLHAAKGLEFPYVFLVGMEEGVLPHKTSIEENNIEEERRLAYVGVTRAKQELTLIVRKQKKSGQAMRALEPSRFIAEMPIDDLEQMDKRTYMAPDSEASKRQNDMAFAELAELVSEMYTTGNQ